MCGDKMGRERECVMGERGVRESVCRVRVGLEKECVG